MRSGGRLQGFGRGEKLVEVRKPRGSVTPRPTDGAATVDQEGRPLGHVAQAAVLDGDVEAVRRLAVPVREQREVEVERLHPGDVRPRRVARDRIRLDAGGAKRLAPVTQELHLARSGRGPVEQVEEQEDRAVRDELLERRSLLRRRPYGPRWDVLARGQHAVSLRERRRPRFELRSPG